MDLSAIQHPASSANVPLDELVGDKHLTEKQKVGEVTRQFEALLLQQILASTQKTVIQSEFSDNSAAAGIYRGMIAHQLAEDISQSDSIGLARMLQHQLTRQLQPDPPDSRRPTGNPAPAAASNAAPTLSNDPAQDADSTLKPGSFIGRAAATFVQP